MRVLRTSLCVLALVAVGVGVSAATGPDPDGAVGLIPGDRDQCERISLCTGSTIANGLAWVEAGLLWQTDFSVPQEVA